MWWLRLALQCREGFTGTILDWSLEISHNIIVKKELRVAIQHPCLSLVAHPTDLLLCWDWPSQQGCAMIGPASMTTSLLSVSRLQLCPSYPVLKLHTKTITYIKILVMELKIKKSVIYNVLLASLQRLILEFHLSIQIPPHGRPHDQELYLQIFHFLGRSAPFDLC